MPIILQITINTPIFVYICLFKHIKYVFDLLLNYFLIDFNINYCKLNVNNDI